MSFTGGSYHENKTSVVPGWIPCLATGLLVRRLVERSQGPGLQKMWKVEMIKRLKKQIYDLFFMTWFFLLKKSEKSNKQKKIRVAKKQKYESMQGQYEKISDLLNDLDTTFKMIKRLKPKKSVIQKMIKVHGTYIVGEMPEDSYFNCKKLDGFKVYGLPTFISSIWTINQRKKITGSDDLKDKVECFLAALKYKGTGIYPIKKNHVIYEVCTVIVDPKPIDLQFFVEVNEITGDVRALKSPVSKTHYFKSKKNGWITYTTNKWCVPELPHDGLKNITNENEQLNELARLFVLVFNTTMLREYSVNINVKKGNERVTFAVPQDRWKYFFKERIKAKNRNGNTKPIFHSVTAHSRKTKKGYTDVKTHYRGLREFWWNRYHVKIVMPGKHGAAQASFGASCYIDKVIKNVDTNNFIDICDSEISKKLNLSFGGHE